MRGTNVYPHNRGHFLFLHSSIAKLSQRMDGGYVKRQTLTWKHEQPQTPGLMDACSRTGIPVGVCQSLLMPRSSSPFTHFLVLVNGIFTEARDLWPNAILIRTVNILHGWVMWCVRSLKHWTQIWNFSHWDLTENDFSSAKQQNQKNRVNRQPARMMKNSSWAYLLYCAWETVCSFSPMI